MLPAPLQFELLPRRPSRAWRLALAALLLVMSVGIAAVWFTRQSVLVDAREQLAQARAAVAGQAPTEIHPAPMLSPQEAQDKALGELSVEPRLLEIERCTDATTILSRFTHDQAARLTTVELDVTTPDRLAVLLECLNTGQDQDQAWKLTAVQSVPGRSGDSGVQRATLRR